MDLDLRKLRYFVTAAELLHFGQAARELHIAQPVLSRQIRALEQELGVALLDRDSRSVSLTAPGRQLLEDARHLLAAAESTKRRVRAAGGARRLTVGFSCGVVVTPAVRAFRASHPDVEIDIRHLELEDQAAAVLESRVDVAFVRLPVAERGLRLVPLFTEPRVAVLPADPPLAALHSITTADLADEQIVRHEHGDPAGPPLPRPRPIEIHPGDAWPTAAVPFASSATLRTVEEKLELVAAGHGVAFLPETAAGFYTRPDVIYIPVADLPPDEVFLASDATRCTPLLQDFTQAAAAHPGRWTATDRGGASGPTRPPRRGARLSDRPGPSARPGQAAVIRT
jgi:DNA-binding transcriptional LysR family regulator